MAASNGVQYRERKVIKNGNKTEAMRGAVARHVTPEVRSEVPSCLVVYFLGAEYSFLNASRSANSSPVLKKCHLPAALTRDIKGLRRLPA